MPTIFTHALLPVIAAVGLSNPRLSSRLVAAGAAVAILPDADIVGRYFGVPHSADFGHRGATHTLIFALLVASLALPSARRMRASPGAAFAFIFLSVLSHPLADMLTSGGKGIMLLWPLEDERFKFWAHPVRASAVGLQGFETGTIWPTLMSELIWLLIPAALLAIFVRCVANLRVRRPGLIDTGHKPT